MILILILCRDLRESRQRYDSMIGELKRKESVIRDLQQRLESTEGCKWSILWDLIYNFLIIYDHRFSIIAKFSIFRALTLTISLSG